MSPSTTPLVRGAALLGALLSVGPLAAAEPRPIAPARPARPAVHEMELFNGPARTVRNFGIGLSPGEAGSLKEMERLENEAAYAQDLLSLKREYVLSDRLLEPYRRTVQQELYGVNRSRTSYAGATSSFGGYGYPYSSYYGVAGYGGLGGYGGFGSASYGGAFSENRSLANGMGDEGRMKEAMAAVIAQQAVPAYAAGLSRDYAVVASRAALSPTLRAGLRLPSLEVTRRERDGIIAAEADLSRTTSPVVLTLKNGDKVRGTRMSKAGDWLSVDLIGGGSSRVRLSEVVRIDTTTKEAVIPEAEGK